MKFCDFFSASNIDGGCSLEPPYWVPYNLCFGAGVRITNGFLENLTSLYKMGFYRVLIARKRHEFCSRTVHVPCQQTSTMYEKCPIYNDSFCRRAILLKICKIVVIIFSVYHRQAYPSSDCRRIFIAGIHIKERK